MAQYSNDYLLNSHFLLLFFNLTYELYLYYGLVIKLLNVITDKSVNCHSSELLYITI